MASFTLNYDEKVRQDYAAANQGGYGEQVHSWIAQVTWNAARVGLRSQAEPNALAVQDPSEYMFDNVMFRKRSLFLVLTTEWLPRRRL